MSIKVNIVRMGNQKYGYDIRLMCGIRFKKNDNTWSRLYEGILDTGSPISVIPKNIWSDLKCNILTNDTLSGIVPGYEMEVNIGRIECRLMDGVNSSDEMDIIAKLAPTDNLPVIIGMKDLLEKFRIDIECKRDIAFLLDKEYPYNSGYDPPMPVLDVNLSSPYIGYEFTYKGELDTGADMTCIPMDATRKLGLSSCDIAETSGYDRSSGPIYEPVFEVALSLPNFNSSVRVIATQRDNVLIGRDLLNKGTLILCGREKIFYIY